MRIVFLGSGEFGLPTLEWLHERHEVVALVSQPDRPAGRRRLPTATPAAQWAQGAGIEVLKTNDVNGDGTIDSIRALGSEVGVVVAFGQKLSLPVVESLGRFAFNLHGSLLPRYRGAAPINWAVVRGETQTGLSVISIAPRMDAGLVFAQCSTDIDPRETAGELHDRLSALGPRIFEGVLAALDDGSLAGRRQDESAVTPAPKLTRADGCVDFNGTAREVRCRVHGLTPWPGVRVIWHRRSDGARQTLGLLRVEEAACASPVEAPGTVLDGARVAVRCGAVRLLEVQVPGRRGMAFEAFTRGHRMAAGDRLESEGDPRTAADRAGKRAKRS